MNLPLFRKEAIDQQRMRLFGEVLVVPKASYIILSSVILIWLIAVLVWLSYASYARKETVSGWLESPAGTIKVYSPASGRIGKVLVANGDYVKKGQPLLEINSDPGLQAGGTVGTEMAELLHVQSRLFRDALESQKRVADNEHTHIDIQIRVAEKNLLGLNEELNIINRRIEIAQKILLSYETLQKKSQISLHDYENIVDRKLSLIQEKQRLSREAAAQLGLIERLKFELLSIDTGHTLKMLDTKQKLNVNEQSLLLTKEKFGSLVTATKDGIINNLQVAEGQFVKIDSDIPLLTILSPDNLLVANVLIPVRAAGFLEVGQKINIRYDAFPYQKFGAHTGVVKQVSETLLLPSEVNNSPIDLIEPVYRVTAEIPQLHVSAYGKKFHLKSGMTFSADIKLSERSLIEWLFEPLISINGNFK